MYNLIIKTMLKKIQSVSEHKSMNQPQRYILSSNPDFIEDYPERAIKAILPELRAYDSTGDDTKTVYVGYSYTNEIMFEVDADSVNVEFRNEKR